jgi:hypothetical protein
LCAHPNRVEALNPKSHHPEIGIISVQKICGDLRNLWFLKLLAARTWTDGPGSEYGHGMTPTGMNIRLLELFDDFVKWSLDPRRASGIAELK